ncbi:MAG: hypothetical protein J5I90_14185 [Caldilineales bacterium]|nr:hypothetical protein [Caldilineales bacterium]
MKYSRAIASGISLVLLLLLLTAFTAPPVGATLAVEQGDWTVGDVIPLRLNVIHPPGYQVIAPELGETWGDFTIRSVSPPRVLKNTDGSETTRINIDASLFQPGDFKPPPLDVTLTDGEGNLLSVEATAALITIDSVLVDGDTTLRDIKPQAVVPIPFPWLAVVIPAIALAFASAGFWYLRHRKHQAAIDKRLPHEKALDELKRIEGLRLPQNGRFKEHYASVSDTMRRYLEQTWNIQMMERTSGEIRVACKRANLATVPVDNFLALLDECDLVKFSEFKPDLESAAGIIATARQIIEATKPVAESNGADARDNSPAKSGGRPAEVTA